MECPLCQKAVSSSHFAKNYCVSCNIILCPKCLQPKPYKKQVTWVRACMYLLISPIVIVYVLFTEDHLDWLSNGVCEHCAQKSKVARILQGKWGVIVTLISTIFLSILFSLIFAKNF